MNIVKKHIILIASLLLVFLALVSIEASVAGADFLHSLQTGLLTTMGVLVGVGLIAGVLRGNRYWPIVVEIALIGSVLFLVFNLAT